ncbi:MAG: class I SAM-dependent methyltransferase [Thiohalocapsa sp.]
MASALLRLSSGWSDALNMVLFLGRLGIYMMPRAKVLDFGCGSGKQTYAMRDLGFDCYGVDIRDYVEYRQPEDRDFFRFAEAPGTDVDYRIDPGTYRIPFQDDFFDVIFSLSVLEHTMDLDAALRECARMLKPGGVVVHCYPGKYAVVEPHVCIPLASFFSPAWWVALWTRLGARNQFNRDKSWQEATAENLRYMATGLNYVGRRQLRAVARHHFTNVTVYSPSEWNPLLHWRGQLRSRLKACFAEHPFEALGMTVMPQALVCQGKRQAPYAAPRLSTRLRRRLFASRCRPSCT